MKARRFLTILMLTSILVLNARLAYAQNSGNFIADSGFRPAANGFAFENYTTESNPDASNLTPADMKRIFGDAVCATTAGDCILTPAAQEWMDATNTDMGGGHCEGMAVLSSMFYYRQQDLSKFNVSAAKELKLDGNVALQREIATWWATQATAPTTAAIIEDKTPSEIVDILIENFKAGADAKDAYTLGIYKPEFRDGHAITPYAISNQGNDKVWIMIYDNNNPGEERHIEVDRKANTWTYNAATNPSEPEDLYQGDADTKTLQLTPNLVRLKPQVCDFCESSGQTTGLYTVANTITYNQVRLDGKGDLLITTSSGGKLGYDQGKLYNTIPNAKIAFLKTVKGRDNDQEPVYFIPTGLQFTVVLDSAQISKDEPASLWLIGPGYVASIEKIMLGKGQKDTIVFAPDGSKLSYTTTSNEKPIITLGFDGKEADYDFEVANLSVDAGATIEVALDRANGKLNFAVKGGKTAASYDLSVTRIDNASERVFARKGIALSAGASAAVNYQKWNGQGNVLTVDVTNPDGSAGQSLALENEKK